MDMLLIRSWFCRQFRRPEYKISEKIMNDIYVNDVRSEDDQSLNLVPRITNFEQLKEYFGLDIDRSQGENKTQHGQRYWKLVGFEVRTGVAAFLTQVKAANGSPAGDILIFNHWPSAPGLSSSANPPYFPNATAGFTDVSGVQGAPYGGGAVTGADGGVYYIWPSADPPGGNRVASDMATKLGWIGGTDHLTANPIFQDTLKEAPLPSGNAKLVVFDQYGNEVGYTELHTGPGTGGRIALFVDGNEEGYTSLL